VYQGDLSLKRRNDHLILGRVGEHFDFAVTISSSTTTTTKVVTVSERVNLHATLTTPAGHIDPSIPTLLLLHYWGGSSGSFSPVVNVLSPYFPTAALSFRSWGDSTGPEEIEAYTTTNSCSDVETVIQTLGLKAVVLVGHSMGGKVAMAVAGRHVVPASILKGLALLAPAPPGPLSIADPSMREQQLHAFDNTDNAEAVINTYLTAQEGPALSDELVKSIPSVVRVGLFGRGRCRRSDIPLPRSHRRFA